MADATDQTGPDREPFGYLQRGRQPGYAPEAERARTREAQMLQDDLLRVIQQRVGRAGITPLEIIGVLEAVKIEVTDFMLHRSAYEPGGPADQYFSGEAGFQQRLEAAAEKAREHFEAQPGADATEPDKLKEFLTKELGIPADQIRVIDLDAPKPDDETNDGASWLGGRVE